MLPIARTASRQSLRGFDATRFRPADPKLNFGGRWKVLEIEQVFGTLSSSGRPKVSQRGIYASRTLAEKSPVTAIGASQLLCCGFCRRHLSKLFCFHEYSKSAPCMTSLWCLAKQTTYSADIPPRARLRAPRRCQARASDGNSKVGQEWTGWFWCIVGWFGSKCNGATPAARADPNRAR